MFRLIVICLVSLSSLLNAKDRPNWIDKKPKDDSVYKYYIGRASDSHNESTGFDTAYKDARDQAIREYGTFTESGAEQYNVSSGDNLFTERVREVSKLVEIKLEVEDWFVERLEKNRANVWVLYKCAVTHIEKEKLRLSKLKEQSQKLNFWDAGVLGQGAHQVFEIVTEPLGADVYIDGKILSGETPVRVKLPSGAHSIQIDHKNYNVISEKLISMGGGVEKRLSYVLKPSFGYLNINTEPNSARVFLDGKPMGTTPLVKAPVRAGQQYVVQIEHPETEKYAQTIMDVQRDETREMNITLPFKPAELLITTDPVKDVAVSIDGIDVGITPLKVIKLERGSRNIALSKEGYEPEKITVYLAGGEHKVLEAIKLTADKKVSISIDSIPGSAVVKIHGNEIGLTPVKDYLVPKGSYEICLTKDGYSDKCFERNFKQGEFFSDAFTLEEQKEDEPTEDSERSTDYRPWDIGFGLGYTFSSSGSINQYFDKNNNGLNAFAGVEKVFAKVVGAKFHILGSLKAAHTGYDFEFYASLPLYIHSFFSTFKNYFAISPLLGYQPYNKIRLDTGYGANIHQYFYGFEFEYRYYLDQSPIGTTQFLLGPGVLFGYKKYDLTGSAIYVAATLSIRMW